MCKGEGGEQEANASTRRAGQEFEYWDADAVGKDNGRGNGNSAKAKDRLRLVFRECNNGLFLLEDWYLDSILSSPRDMYL